jgi:hypothetical protein
MRPPHHVECRLRPLPRVEGIALVASTRAAKFLPAEVEVTADGTSWRSLDLVRDGHPGERIALRTVCEDPLVIEIRFETDADCGPVAFHLAMETQGRTLDGWPEAGRDS